ncbi:hypothetical protein Acr_00g0015680 [Actinidia rufa]|uniref:Uncharacterized protein n=1 Tax=Actinidia rufa TaxID=165716 RepID=A0A7J0DAX8_9ERIC|nr:hypothetical protein Acr_00g0015680 [Actinidia rufa]
MLHTMYHLNGPEDVVPPRAIIPLRAIPPRLVIGIKEKGPSRIRNYYGKIQYTARKSVPCPAYFKKLMFQVQPEGSHEVNSPYWPNTFERARQKTHDPMLVLIEISSSN